MALTLVFGNEKGGTGKSTIAMHVAIFFLRKGLRVGTIDVDARQGTLTRYIQNRALKKQTHPHINLPLPFHISLPKSAKSTVEENETDEKARFLDSLEQFRNCDIVIIDTPGSDQHLSRFAHAHADILITPMNDSLIDLDLLVHLDDAMTIIHPSTYSEMVWAQRKEKAIRSRGHIEWIVLRNRISNMQSRNHLEMDRILKSLAKRIGFHYLEGLSDRVIFRELFLTGMTLLDMRENRIGLSLSHIAAREELTSLVTLIESFNQPSSLTGSL